MRPLRPNVHFIGASDLRSQSLLQANTCTHACEYVWMASSGHMPATAAWATQAIGRTSRQEGNSSGSSAKHRSVVAAEAPLFNQLSYCRA